LSFAAVFQPKWQISKADFSWDEPLKGTIWSLFGIDRKNSCARWMKKAAAAKVRIARLGCLLGCRV
jgi:hypothetical protein